MKLLSQDVKITRVANAAAAGTTAVTGTSVDCATFGAATFYAMLGAITAGGSGNLKVQQSDAAATGFTDLAGASASYTDADGNRVLVVEVNQPRKRYLRPVVTRSAENAVVDGVLAMQSQAHAEPVTHGSTVVAPVLVLAPAEV